VMRTKKSAEGLHFAALAALFTLGNVLLRYPWSRSGRGEAVLCLLSVLASSAVAALLFPMLRWLLRDGQKSPFRRFLQLTIAVPTVGYALFCAARCCYDFTELAVELILPDGSRLFTAGLFLLCACLLARLSTAGVNRFCLISLTVSLLCVLILFVIGASQLRWSLFSGDLLALPTEIGNTLPIFLTEAAAPLLLLSMLFAMEERAGSGGLTVGILTGGVILLACVAQAILTFGGVYAAELPYPYVFSTRILSVGPYFFRVEGLSYLPILLACLARAALCLRLVVGLCRRFGR